MLELEEASLQQWSQRVGYDIVHIVLQIQKVPGMRVRAEFSFFPLYSLLLMWCSSFWIRQGRSHCLTGNIWAAPVQWTASSHRLITFSHPFRQKTHWTTLSNKKKMLVFFFSLAYDLNWFNWYQIGYFLVKSRVGGNMIWKRKEWEAWLLLFSASNSNPTEIHLGNRVGWIYTIWNVGS